MQRIAEKIEAKKGFQELARRIAKSDYSLSSDIERVEQYFKFDKAFAELGEYFEAIGQEINSLKDSLGIIAFGGDLRQYMRFRQLSPRITITVDGSMDVYEIPEWQPDKEQAVEVLAFVFDTILHWQQLPLT